MAARTADGFVKGYARGDALYDWYGRLVGRIEGRGRIVDWAGQVVGHIDVYNGTVYDVNGRVVGKVERGGFGEYTVRKIEGWVAGTVEDVYEAALLLFPLT
ncbi:MAG: hypothetical protein QW815_06700 [Nitrososphaerota archaeon]